VLLLLLDGGIVGDGGGHLRWGRHIALLSRRELSCHLIDCVCALACEASEVRVDMRLKPHRWELICLLRLTGASFPLLGYHVSERCQDVEEATRLWICLRTVCH
jgi:hypothetical protein